MLPWLEATGVNQPLMYIADCAAYELMKMKFKKLRAAHDAQLAVQAAEQEQQKQIAGGGVPKGAKAAVAAMGAVLKKLQSLTSLNLNFAACSQLADVAALGAGLEKLQALTSLNLNFIMCTQLRADLQKSFNSKDAFLAAVGA